MTRRVHVPKVTEGQLPLPADEAHHLRDVLRLSAGTDVELFDAIGNVGSGRIIHCDGAGVVVQVDSIRHADPGLRIVVAAAVPKGDRADWMIEKLSELGVSCFVPLRTSRSVVTAEGTNKRDRWQRIATESAKQSRRAGVMEIVEPMPVASAIEQLEPGEPAWCLSTANARQIDPSIFDPTPPARFTLFIGPEGGWTDEELARFTAAGVTHVGLTRTVLRVETAAVVAAGLVATLLGVRSAAASDSDPT